LEFECGFDLKLTTIWSDSLVVFGDGHHGSEWSRDHLQEYRQVAFSIELKPQMGDDFPTVLRQMKRNGADTLVIGSFEATTCTLKQVRAMFGEKKIVTLQEIESIQQKGPMWP